jgi:hypothetical protein
MQHPVLHDPVHLLRLQLEKDNGGKSGVISFYNFNLCEKMVGNITTVINEYEERVRIMQVVLLFSHERRMLRSDGAPNRAFFVNDHSISKGHRPSWSTNDAVAPLNRVT